MAAISSVVTPGISRNELNGEERIWDESGRVRPQPGKTIIIAKMTNTEPVFSLCFTNSLFREF
jgi:hypothetical protein